MAYPMEFRYQVAAAYDQCGSSIEVAREYGCSESWVRRLIADKPDMTLGELAEAMDHKASVTTVWRATQALDLPLKKKRRTPPSRTGRT